jgi:hypothetical protein
VPRVRAGVRPAGDDPARDGARRARDAGKRVAATGVLAARRRPVPVRALFRLCGWRQLAVTRGVRDVLRVAGRGSRHRPDSAVDQPAPRSCAGVLVAYRLLAGGRAGSGPSGWLVAGGAPGATRRAGDRGGDLVRDGPHRLHGCVAGGGDRRLPLRSRCRARLLQLAVPMGRRQDRGSPERDRSAGPRRGAPVDRRGRHRAGARRRPPDGTARAAEGAVEAVRDGGGQCRPTVRPGAAGGGRTAAPGMDNRSGGGGERPNRKASDDYRSVTGRDASPNFRPRFVALSVVWIDRGRERAGARGA